LSTFALAIVLAAAVLHASWNALVKASKDRSLILAAVAGMHAATGAVLITIGPPPDPSSWIAIVLSTLIHYGYYALLFHAYRLGDLSQVYPISRGLSPTLVAFGTFAISGENLTIPGWIGLVSVSVGIGLLALQRGAVHADRRAVGVAVLLGACIGAYSVTDGLGVRASQSPIGYMGWLFLLEAPVVLAVLLPRVVRRHRIDWPVFSLGMVGGAFSVAAYGVVLYAQTIAPIAAVSAVRESSVIIAALIGVVFFRERPWLGRVLAAVVVAAGVTMLAVSD
jgi:drug/metabolite transporter (DMT)-like permease